MAQALCPFLCHLRPEVGASCYFGPCPRKGLQLMMGPVPLAGVGVSRCGPHPWALVRPSPGRASLHDKASLRLEQVRSEDQGWYECKVLMLDQQYDTFHNGSWVHLTINGEYGSPPRSLFSGGTHR